MTVCAIKVCRNYKGRLRTSKKITYHQIPIDPVLRSRWVDIIRKSRGEDCWQPAKTTVICSEHFHPKQFANNQGRQRLKKEAIPCKALFLSSLKSDDSESEDLVEEVETISDCKTNIVEDTNFFEIKVDECFNVRENSEDISTLTVEISDKSSDICIESPCTSSFIPEQAAEIAESQKTENDIIEDFSDLDSVYDSPTESKLRRELRRKINLQKKHTLKIQSLTRKILRLKKKITSYKQIIGILKKERHIDNDIHNTLSGNVVAADLYSTILKKLKGSKTPNREYSSEFRKFCVKLHSLSPKAYSYVRNEFETCLPHPKTLPKWHVNINACQGPIEDA